MSESSFLDPARAVAAAGLHEGMKVADFGAGAGFFTRAAARVAGVHGEVWAVDSNADLLPRIKTLAQAEGLHNVEVVRGNAEHVGGTHLPAATFDVCIVANLLFAAQCKSCLADEAARILKRGGRVLLIDWTGSHGGLGPHPRQVVGKADALREFESHGFVFVDNLPAGGYHWGCILKKK